MTITASTAQLGGTPVTSTGQSTTVTTTGILINGASFSPSYTANADEIVLVSNPSGTLSGDCSVQIQVAANTSNFGVIDTFTNAQIVSSDGFAKSVRVGLGNTFRVRFVAGTTSGAGNGVSVRFRN